MSEKPPESPWSALSKAPKPGDNILVVRACASCKQGSTLERTPDGECRLCGRSFDPEPPPPPTGGPGLSPSQRSRFDVCAQCDSEDLRRSHNLDVCNGCGQEHSHDPEKDRWVPTPLDPEALARAYRSMGLRPPPPIE